MNDNKIELDTLVLSDLMQSAADSLHAAHTGGMRTVLVREDMTLRDFMRFCLGRDVIGNPMEEKNEKRSSG